jgi:hypothetical protein
MQPPPEHVSVQLEPAPHRWVQPPPEHVKLHVPSASQLCSQRPPLHVLVQLAPRGQANAQPPLPHVFVSVPPSAVASIAIAVSTLREAAGGGATRIGAASPAVAPVHAARASITRIDRTRG